MSGCITALLRVACLQALSCLADLQHAALASLHVHEH